MLQNLRFLTPLAFNKCYDERSEFLCNTAHKPYRGEIDAWLGTPMQRSWDTRYHPKLYRHRLPMQLVGFVLEYARRDGDWPLDLP